MRSEGGAAGEPKQFPQLWDDEAFRERLIELVERKGMSVKEAMQEIGLTADYVYRAAEGRTTNLLMVIAKYFKVSPAWLAGWTLDTGSPPPEWDDEKFVARVADLLAARNLDVKEVLSKLGIAPDWLLPRDRSRGQYRTIAHVVDLARILDVPLSTLVEDD